MVKHRGKILLVEDDKNFALVLKSYLEIHFLRVDISTDGLSALKQLKKDNYTLCILDVVMPNMDGFELAKQIRRHYPELRYIFLTSRNLKEDIIKGYELSAVDYLCKPFDSEILLLKIKALIDVPGVLDSPNDEIIEIGDYLFNPVFRTLSIQDSSQKLTAKESKLLLLLTKYQNKILKRELAQTQIWGDSSYFIGRSMDVFISKLRAYLNQDPRITIENLRGEGYSLMIKE